MSLGKASIARAAGAKSRQGAAGQPVKNSVLTPMNAEEIQMKFLSDASKEAPENKPVQLTQKMPDYLL